MWKCPECETINEDEICIMCGRAKGEALPQVKIETDSINPIFDGGVTVNYKMPARSVGAAEAAAVKATGKESGKGGKKLKIVLICLASVIGAVLIAFGALFGYYLSAKGDFNDGDYKAAEEKFAKIAFFADSRDMVSRCGYENAKALFESGNYNAAKEEFIKLDGYENSYELIFECEYKMLLAYKDKNDFESASKLIETMVGNREDSRIKEIEIWCNHAYAKSIIESEPERARELLEEIDEDYEDTKKLISECTYVIAKAYEADGEYEKAYEEFGKCIEYKDSEYLRSSLQPGIIKSAVAAYEDGRYEDSIRMFELCTNLTGEEAEQVEAYELFLSYKTGRDGIGDNEELFSYLGSYTAARKIVLEDEGVFADFIYGDWFAEDELVLEFSSGFSLEESEAFGISSGRCRYEGYSEGNKLFVNNREVIRDIEIISENKIKICTTKDSKEHILTRGL